MQLTLAQIKDIMAGFINRKADLLKTESGNDLLLFALNAAKTWAQRTHDFFYLETRGYLEPASEGTSFKNGILSKPGGVPLLVKKIKRAFNSSLIPVPFISSGDVHKSVYGPALLQQGDKLFAYPNTNSTGFYVDVIQLLPDYSDTFTSDFFLTEHADWLMYSGLHHLNFYLKEDERVQISANQLSTLWQSVLTWDSGFESETINEFY